MTIGVMALLCLGANEGVVPSLRDGWLVAGALAADDVQFARHEAGLLEIEVGIDDISPTGCIRSLSRAVSRRRYCDDKASVVYARERSWEVGLSANDDFTDLDDRRLIGIVWDVRHNLLGMRPKTGLEGFDRVAEDVAHSDICRGSAGRSTGQTLVNRVGLASITHASFHEWHMLIPVVRVVEACARRIGIHNAYLDHGGLPVPTFAV